jgi:hypothetical protein
MTPESMFTGVAWIIGAGLLFGIGYVLFKFFME